MAKDLAYSWSLPYERNYDELVISWLGAGTPISLPVRGFTVYADPASARAADSASSV